MEVIGFYLLTTFSGKEALSTYRTEDISTITFLYNDTMIDKSFAITGTKTDLGGVNIYQNSVVLQPFTYLVLLPKTIIPTSNKVKMKVGNNFIGVSKKILRVAVD